MQDRPTCMCMICEQMNTEGIHILSRFICAECEQEIVNTEVDDDLYDYFVDRLRALWRDVTGRSSDASGPSYS